VIFLSHITSPTALIFPVESIVRRAREAGILTVVDGAHTAGQIPLCLDSLGADFYGGNLHKWLCAPKGAGFLYARPQVQHVLKPLVVSWGYESEMPSGSTFVDHHQWWGTRDIAAFLSVPDAIEFQRTHDWEEIRAACHELARESQERICGLTGLVLKHPGSRRVFVVCQCDLSGRIHHAEGQQDLSSLFLNSDRWDDPLASIAQVTAPSHTRG